MAEQSFLNTLYEKFDIFLTFAFFIYFSVKYRLFLLVFALVLMYTHYKYFSIDGTLRLLFSYTLIVAIARIGYLSGKRLLYVLNVLVRKKSDTQNVLKKPLWNIMALLGFVFSGYVLL